jgi:hypothetical protein
MGIGMQNGKKEMVREEKEGNVIGRKEGKPREDIKNEMERKSEK